MKYFLINFCLVLTVIAKDSYDVAWTKETENLKKIYESIVRQAVEFVNRNPIFNDNSYWNLSRITKSKVTKTLTDRKHNIVFTMIQSNCASAKNGLIDGASTNCNAVLNRFPLKQVCKLEFTDFELRLNKFDPEYFECMKFEEYGGSKAKTLDETEAGNEISLYEMNARLRDMHRFIQLDDLPHWIKFKGYINAFNRKYESAMKVLKRFHVYKSNQKRIEKLRILEKGTAVYGDTVFSDMTPQEFQQVMLPRTWEFDNINRRIIKLSEFNVSTENMPSNVDWRKKNAITDVKNQGNCGSCWAFSVTGNIEGAWAIKTGKLVSLSEEQLVDCDKVDHGCAGGLPLNAYKEIIRMGGLEPEDAYPYTAHQGRCRIKASALAVNINDSVQLPLDEVKMAAWLSKKGPISVGVNANNLQFYRHGITHPFKMFCMPDMLNHAVLIVGYGTENRKPYWIIKNSWGERWGESGYYRLYRGKNVCGVNKMATSAIIY